MRSFYTSLSLFEAVVAVAVIDHRVAVVVCGRDCGTPRGVLYCAPLFLLFGSSGDADIELARSNDK